MLLPPDRFVHDPTFDPADGIMEVKCPVATMERPEVAAVTKKGFCLQSGNGKVSLNREHAYYYQVMCQMSCSGRSWCDFVMCGGEIFVERIHYDSKFWADCVPKLHGFYMEYLLPELACPGQCKAFLLWTMIHNLRTKFYHRFLTFCGFNIEILLPELACQGW